MTGKRWILVLVISVLGSRGNSAEAQSAVDETARVREYLRQTAAFAGRQVEGITQEIDRVKCRELWKQITVYAGSVMGPGLIVMAINPILADVAALGGVGAYVGIRWAMGKAPKISIPEYKERFEEQWRALPIAHPMRPSEVTESVRSDIDEFGRVLIWGLRLASDLGIPWDIEDANEMRTAVLEGQRKVWQRERMYARGMLKELGEEF
jgi:hypothetical protein